jgi:hypothetical protein
MSRLQNRRRSDETKTAKKSLENMAKFKHLAFTPINVAQFKYVSTTFRNVAQFKHLEINE